LFLALGESNGERIGDNNSSSPGKRVLPLENGLKKRFPPLFFFMGVLETEQMLFERDLVDPPLPRLFLNLPEAALFGE
jgi:hypothetical protein